MGNEPKIIAASNQFDLKLGKKQHSHFPYKKKLSPIRLNQ